MSSSTRDLSSVKLVVVGLLMFAAVFLAFFPLTRNEFVNMDDPGYIYANPQVTSGLSWHGINWAFHTREGGFWHPLTWISIMLDCQLYKLNPAGHHLTNALLHACNSVALLVLLWKMTGSLWRSACVASLFGLHPLHVESVAWAAERKDVLSTFFLMLTLWSYAKYCKVREESKTAHRRSRVWTCYFLALLFFVLGLMSKAMLVTTPLLLLLTDVWPLRRIKTGKRPAGLPLRLVLQEKAPLFVIAIVFGLMTLKVQGTIGAIQPVANFPISNRIANALLSYAIYLRQMVCPIDLAVFYPYPKHFPMQDLLVAALVVAGISALAFWQRRERAYLICGWLWYLVALLPVIGIVQAGGQGHADRYTYVPMIGIFVALVWGAHSVALVWRIPRVVEIAVASVSLFVCLGFTEQQIKYWKNSESLFTRALAVTKNNEVAHNNLGTELGMKGRLQEAMEQFEQAALAAPHDPVAHANLGAALFNAGNLEKSVQESQEAVRLNPRHEEAHRNLGAAFGVMGRLDDALRELRIATNLMPGDAEAHYNLAFALESKGDLLAAISEYRKTLALAPDHAFARTNLQSAEAVLAKAAQSQNPAEKSKQ
jgi:Flp pilus assembly protein TadD